ncbi:MAG: hypothetical protein U1E98_04310 [Moraxella osloensis]
MIKKVSTAGNVLTCRKPSLTIHAALAYCKSQLNNLGDKGFIQPKLPMASII